MGSYGSAVGKEGAYSDNGNVLDVVRGGHYYGRWVEFSRSGWFFLILADVRNRKAR